MSRLIYMITFQMHHIYSEKKKEKILKLAKRLNITGIYKFGKPGRLILFEPEEDKNLSIFEKEIKSLNWQTCTVTLRRVFHPSQFVVFNQFVSVESDVELRELLIQHELKDIWHELTGFKN
ncbi:hypothetical protein K502DRAFT_259639 [Neoconidiobolus thromboides FSU 785]|nr:hypothetical protein K502DRAFT_259639 [Neoconidiobolus thromboides FSU 785]